MKNIIVILEYILKLILSNLLFIFYAKNKKIKKDEFISYKKTFYLK